MRHLLSFVLALVLTPLIYVSAGFSAVKFGEANNLGVIEIVPGLLGLVAAFVAGGLYALLVMTRLSPVGPVFAGLVYLGVTLWALLDPGSLSDIVPADLFGVRNLLHIPVPFGTALLTVPLILTIFSPRRWRRGALPAALTPEFQAAPTYAPESAFAAPVYEQSSYEPPVYATSTYEPPSYGTPASTLPSYEPPVYSPPGQASSPPNPIWPPAGNPSGEDPNKTNPM